MDAYTPIFELSPHGQVRATPLKSLPFVDSTSRTDLAVQYDYVLQNLGMSYKEFIVMPIQQKYKLIRDTILKFIDDSAQQYAIANGKLADVLRREGTTLRTSKAIPRLLKLCMPLRDRHSYDRYTNESITDVINVMLSYQPEYYYTFLYRVKYLGSGSFGSSVTAPIITESTRYKLAQAAWDMLNNRPYNFVDTRDKTLVIKNTGLDESDSIILAQLSLVPEMWWIHPTLYSTIIHFNAPEYLDPTVFNFDTKTGNLVGTRLISDFPDRDLYSFQEYIDGVPLTNVLPILTKKEKLDLELVILSGLRLLYNRIGFIHGDLGPQNILMMRGTYFLPVYDEGGTVMGVVITKYRPVIIDYGMAQTHDYAKWAEFATPNTGPERDIMVLHTNFHPEDTEFKDLWRKTYNDKPEYHNYLKNIVAEGRMGITYNSVIDWIGTASIYTNISEYIPSSSHKYTEISMNPEERKLYTEFINCISSQKLPDPDTPDKTLAYSFLEALLGRKNVH